MPPFKPITGRRYAYIPTSFTSNAPLFPGPLPFSHSYIRIIIARTRTKHTYATNKFFAYTKKIYSRNEMGECEKIPAPKTTTENLKFRCTLALLICIRTYTIHLSAQAHLISSSSHHHPFRPILFPPHRFRYLFPIYVRCLYSILEGRICICLFPKLKSSGSYRLWKYRKVCLLKNQIYFDFSSIFKQKKHHEGYESPTLNSTLLHFTWNPTSAYTMRHARDEKSER